MKWAAMIVPGLLAASAAQASEGVKAEAQERLAWSMLTLLGGEAGEQPCTASGAVCAHVAGLEALRRAEPSLIRGDVRTLPTDRAPHVLAVARRLPEGNRAPFIDTILVFNTSAKAVSATVMVDRRIDVSKSLLGRCPMPSPGGVLEVKLAPYEALVCAGAVAVN